MVAGNSSFGHESAHDLGRVRPGEKLPFQRRFFEFCLPKRLAGEHTAKCRLKVFQRLGVIAWVEGQLIPALAEIYRGLVVFVFAKNITLGALLIRQESIIETLKKSVVAHDPRDLFPNKRADDFVSDLTMSVRGEYVTNIVQKAAHHPIVVTSVSLGTRCGLQYMFQSIDQVRSVILCLHPQVTHEPVG